MPSYDKFKIIDQYFPFEVAWDCSLSTNYKPILRIVKLTF